MKTVCSVLSALTAVLAAALWLCPSPVVADIVVTDLIAGDDFGWSVTYDNSVVGISAGEVHPAGDYMVIQISEDFTLKQPPTPEPATIALMGFGLAAIFVRRKRLRRG